MVEGLSQVLALKRIIETFVSRDNSTGNETIKSPLTGDVSSVVADTIVSEMSKGFIGRARGELDANESKFSDGDRGDAMVVTEETFLYTNVFLLDLELRSCPNITCASSIHL